MELFQNSRITDLTGSRYGRWTVVKYTGTDSNKKHLWLCECDCGITKNIRSFALANGSSTSCGCLRNELTSSRIKSDVDQRRESIIGKTFNRLTIIELSHIDPYRNAYYKCKCACGNITIVRGSNLNGHTKSCGCLFVETHSSHGLTNHPLYGVWINIRRRCNNEEYEAYHNYGGRGIYVCSEWDESFESFYNWAINNGYSHGLSIDRIDNSMGYHPQNCRFTTYEEQNRNRRSTILNEQSVLDIRRSQESSNHLADKYGISVDHVNGIRAGKTWKNVQLF